MKIAVFTSNQPRHVSLVETLSPLCDEILVIQECSTLFPGTVDDFYRQSDTMRSYFERMMAAERAVFGHPRFLPKNARSMAMKLGDVNAVPPASLDDALAADVIIVFGASYIRDPLVRGLIEKKAVNIHMGVSPYYRGATCNFWALKDGRADMVGATIHLLSAGLDSGDMLFHALPAPAAIEPFTLGMLAVRAAHRGLAARIRDGTLLNDAAVKQEKSLEMRYSKKAEFTDAVADEYLRHTPSPDEILHRMEARDRSLFLRPYVDDAFARRSP